MKFYLNRIRINQGGYTDKGEYYGIGQPLFQAQCPEVLDYAGREKIHTFRALDREDAKDYILMKYPGATFYR